MMLLKLKTVILSSIWITLITNIEYTLSETLCEEQCDCSTVDVDWYLISISCKNTSMKTIENFVNGINQRTDYLKRFEISNSLMFEISNSTFANFNGFVYNSEELLLTYNNVEFIWENSFNNFHNLQSLDLRHNKITFIDNFIFTRLNNIRTLNLGFNKIQSLNGSMFQYLGNLESLFVNNNQLKTIYKDMFSGLSSYSFRTLDLSHNEIDSVENFETLNNLQNLNISFNKLQSINSTMFENMQNLVDLNLEYNHLQFVANATFKPATNLQRLQLNNNHFQNITRHMFDECLNLQYLYLQENKIITITPEAFSYLRNLIFFNLSGNSIVYLKNNTFMGLTNLRELNLTDLNISHVLPGAFNSMTKLTYLDLSANSFKSWPSKAFSGLQSLQFIYFGSNNIDTLHEFAFYGLNNLRELTIHGVDIFNPNTEKTIQKNKTKANIIIVKGMEILDLKNTTFAGLSGLDTLNLVDLHIAKVNSGALQGLLNLKRFRLCNTTLEQLKSYALMGFGQNAHIISRCSGSIQPGNNERWYMLDNLRLRSIKADAFSGLNAGISNSELFYLLYLNNNNVTTLVSNTFRNLSYVRLLRLDSNLIEEIEPYAFNTLSFHKEGYYRTNQLRSSSYNSMYLNSSKLGNLRSNAFSNIQNIVELRIDNNNISEIQPRAFDGLSFHNHVYANIYNQDTVFGCNSLYLNHSKITHLLNGTFANVSHLALLKLDHNAIERIEPGTFHGLLMLSTIISNEGSRTHEYNSIYLNNNNLTTLVRNTFLGIENLNILRLENNYISRIDADTFMGLNTLKTLKLTSNNLKDVIVNMFQNLPQLETLDLNDNKISSLNPESFAGLISLRNLLLDNNKIKELSVGTFKNFPLLKILQLGNNQISQLKIGSFSNLGNLEQLNFSYNSFSALNETVLYPLKNLELLDLDHNNFSYINYTSLLLHLPSLRYISVNENKWACDLLTHMLKTFRTSGVDYLFNRTSRYTEENVDGILCTTETEERGTVSNYADENKNEDISITQLQRIELSLENIFVSLNNVSTILETTNSNRNSSAQTVVEYLERLLEKNDNLNSNIQKEVETQNSIPQKVNDSSRTLYTNEDLKPSNPYVTVVDMYIVLSLTFICILLSVMVYKRHFNTTRNKKRIEEAHSEIELLNANM